MPTLPPPGGATIYQFIVSDWLALNDAQHQLDTLVLAAFMLNDGTNNMRFVFGRDQGDCDLIRNNWLAANGFPGPYTTAGPFQVQDPGLPAALQIDFVPEVLNQAPNPQANPVPITNPNSIYVAVWMQYALNKPGYPPYPAMSFVIQLLPQLTANSFDPNGAVQMEDSLTTFKVF